MSAAKPSRLDDAQIRAGLERLAGRHPELSAKKDHAGRNQVLSTLLVLYTALGVICLALVALLADTAPHWFELDQQQREAFTIALWLLGTAVAVR